MKKITVTYTLTSSQEERLQKICDKLKNRNLEEQFEYMMQIGSVDDINQKITTFEEFHGIV